jgi:hypothetical protein
MTEELETSPASSTGDFDMAGAVSEIASGLGLGVGNAAHDDDGPSDAANSPAADGNLDATSQAQDGSQSEATSSSKPGEGDKADSPTTPPAPATADLTQAPKTWRKEVAAAWSTLPEAVRAEIHKREQDMYTGIEQYKEGANFAWQVHGLFKPYEHVMQQLGIGPEQILPGLVQAHGTLSLGSEDQKLSLLGQLIKDYAIPVPKLLAQLTGGALDNVEPFVDPEVKSLREKLAAVESRLTAQDRYAAQAKQAEIRKTVEAFASDPKNVYFAELADDIAALLRSGVVKDIGAAYEKAMWANPVTREKEQARRAAEAESERTRKAAEAAAKAKKAMGANVRTTVRSGSPTAPKSSSLDETLEKTYAAIMGRSN